MISNSSVSIIVTCKQKDPIVIIGTKELFTKFTHTHADRVVGTVVGKNAIHLNPKKATGNKLDFFKNLFEGLDELERKERAALSNLINAIRGFDRCSKAKAKAKVPSLTEAELLFYTKWGIIIIISLLFTIILIIISIIRGEKVNAIFYETSQNAV